MSNSDLHLVIHYELIFGKYVISPIALIFTGFILGLRVINVKNDLASGLIIPLSLLGWGSAIVTFAIALVGLYLLF